MSQLLDILQSDEELAQSFVDIAEGRVPLTPGLAEEFGYERKNNIPAEYIFAVDVVNEVFDLVGGSRKNSNDIFHFLKGFLGPKIWKKDFASALVHGRGLVPLARMFSAAGSDSYAALGLLVAVTLGHKETEGFPEGYLLPCYEYDQTVEAIRAVQKNIKKIIEQNRKNSVVAAAEYYLVTDPLHFWNLPLGNETVIAENLSQESLGYRVSSNTADDESRFPVWEAVKEAEEHLPTRIGTREEEKTALSTAAPEEEMVASFLDMPLTAEPFHSFFRGMPSHEGVKEKMSAILLDGVLSLSRSSQGAGTQFYSNIFLAGAPGVGKTELAVRTAQAMKALGAIPRDSHIALVTASSLVGTKVGEVTDLITRAFRETARGILIIDEIDHFVNVHSYGRNALSAINGLIGKPDMPALVIGTLYEQNVDQIFAKEEGLRRRFPHVLRMKPYTGKELLSLFEKRAIQIGFNKPSEEVLLIAEKRLSSRAGGAGEVDALLHEIKRNNTIRILKKHPDLLVSGRDNIGATQEAEVLKLSGEISLEDFPRSSVTGLPAGMLRAVPRREDGGELKAVRPEKAGVSNVVHLYPKKER